MRRPDGDEIPGDYNQIDTAYAEVCLIPQPLTTRTGSAMLNADQLLARLYALRKDYADDPEDETYQAIHAAFLFISYNMAAFKEYVRKEAEKTAQE